MNAAQLILQFADAVSPLLSQPLDKASLAGKVREHIKTGQCSEAVTKAFYDNVDSVATHVEERMGEMLKGYQRLCARYEKETA
jgi:hypothetical protein